MDWSCGCDGALPSGFQHARGSRSKWVEDISGSMAVDTSQDPLQLRFTWLIETRQTLPHGSYMEAEFPDPTDVHATPYRVPFMRLATETLKAEQKGDRYYAISPVLPKTECRMYTIRLKIYEDQKRLSVLSEHSGQILCRINSEKCLRDDFISYMKSLQS